MARTSTSWQPTVSGNTKGRPPKKRARTEILARTGRKTIVVGGKRINRWRWLAETIWQTLQSGTLVLEQANLRDVPVNEWIDLVKWLYAQVDGAPKQESNVTLHSDGTLTIREVVVIGTDDQATSGTSDVPA